MVNMIEASSNISFYEPRRTFELLQQTSQCCMATASGSKTVRAVSKARLVIGFQHHSQCFLHQFICEVRNTKWACPSTLFGNLNAVGWFEAILLFTHLMDNPLYTSAAHSIRSVTFCSLCECTLIPGNLVVGSDVQILIYNKNTRLRKLFCSAN